jgi:hypothetical protein
MPKISVLPPDSTLDLADVFPVVSGGGTKKITLQDLITAMSPYVLSNFTGWADIGATVSTVTYNGNRSYDLVFNNNDLSDTVSAGMRIKTTRSTAAPIQCASLNGTTQYFTKASATSLGTFTDDFAVGAWIKLSSYAAGGIVTRRNGTQGWALEMASTGQIQIVGFNAALSNFSLGITYQSIPLNKWVHVAGQLDMSAFTASSTTSYIMIDGVDVPISISRGGTNPTSLVQAGNLEVGAQNGGTTPFPGKIAQAFYSNAKIPQANIRTLISQGLTSGLISTNNIVSAYSLSNSTLDLNATSANNLSVGGGAALTTNADSPFGCQADGTRSTSLDYAIVTKIAFSTNTTITVQVPEGCTIPTSGGVASVDVSGIKAPYGMPVQRAKWQVIWLTKAYSAYNGANNTWSSGSTNGTYYMSVPVGEWNASYDLSRYGDAGASVYVELWSSLSTSNSSESDPNWTVASRGGVGNGAAYLALHQTKSGALSVATATPYYILAKAVRNDAGVTGSPGLNTMGSASTVVLENGYL